MRVARHTPLDLARAKYLPDAHYNNQTNQPRENKMEQETEDIIVTEVVVNGQRYKAVHAEENQCTQCDLKDLCDQSYAIEAFCVELSPKKSTFKKEHQQ